MRSPEELPVILCEVRGHLTATRKLSSGDTRQGSLLLLFVFNLLAGDGDDDIMAALSTSCCSQGHFLSLILSVFTDCSVENIKGTVRRCFGFNDLHQTEVVRWAPLDLLGTIFSGGWI